ncbi:hypothetical protein YC2023_038462 [Brassica napus]
MYVPFVGTQAWIRSHNNSLTDYWRPWMIGTSSLLWVKEIQSQVDCILSCYESILINSNNALIRFTLFWADKLGFVVPIN